MTLDIVTRAEWGARAPKHRRRIPVPTPELWLHHTAGALDANGNGVWWDDMRQIQNFHMDDRGWSDIAYSFCIAGGQVFEARGAEVAGGHTKGRNSVSHAICFVGNYEWMDPHPDDLDACVRLIRHGREQGWWDELTGPHRDAPGASTACCGKNLIAKIPRIRFLSARPEGPLMALTDEEQRQLLAYAKQASDATNGDASGLKAILDQMRIANATLGRVIDKLDDLASE